MASSTQTPELTAVRCAVKRRMRVQMPGTLRPVAAAFPSLKPVGIVTYDARRPAVADTRLTKGFETCTD